MTESPGSQQPSCATTEATGPETLSSPILHVFVVGFHHKKGCQVEYCYPPLKAETGGEVRDGDLPDEWQHLPSLALPDGAHNVEKDTVFFLLPSKDVPNRSVYGVSCFRQVSAKDLLCKDEDVTRSTVQKSVCVLSRLPLFGSLKAKLELITQAYFNERNFAKVEVLAEMYTNLCATFTADMVKTQALLGLSARESVRKLKHKVLMLFKLILLEKRELWNKVYQKHRFTYPESVCHKIVVALLDKNPMYNQQMMRILEIRSRFKNLLANHPVVSFTNYVTSGYLCHPYLSLAYLDYLKANRVRSYIFGATNALYKQRKDLLDAIVFTDDAGEIQVEILDSELRKQMAMTTADLRFGDFIVKSVSPDTGNVFLDATGWEGGDEWIRLQFRAYLLSLIATIKAGDHTLREDFNEAFLDAWRTTHNFRVWSCGHYPDLKNAVPGHPFAGQIGVSDVRLKLYHSVHSSQQGRKLAKAATETGKYVSLTGKAFKSRIAGFLWNDVSSEQLSPSAEHDEGSEEDKLEAS